MNEQGHESNKKKAIVIATISSIKRRGFSNFSMQDVAKEAGVSKGIIHYYFLNKDDLMVDVFNEWSQSTAEQLILQIKKALDPKEQLTVFSTFYFEAMLKDKEIFQILIDLLAKKDEKMQISEVLTKHYRLFRGICADVLKQGLEKGFFKNVEPWSFSQLFWGILDGLSIQYFVDNKAMPLVSIKKILEETIIANLSVVSDV